MANVARMIDIKRSASKTVKPARSRQDVSLPAFVPPQLSQPVEKPPSGAQWLHEIKLDGYRMAARIDMRSATVNS
jgi:bifunctional non-homologous end joining protein LigD